MVIVWVREREGSVYLGSLQACDWASVNKTISGEGDGFVLWRCTSSAALVSLAIQNEIICMKKVIFC
jgi:hypothetical protein